MYCRKCGLEIDEGSEMCPYCGEYVEEFGARRPVQTQSNGMAIAGLICAFISPLLGWIFGGIGLSRANKNPAVGGKGMAIAAIIVASLMFVFNFIYTMKSGLV